MILSILLLLLIGGIVLFGIHLYHISNYTRLQVEFSELEPFAKHMPIYFKGFKIGKVTKVVPIDDFTATRMHIVLFPKNLKFPKNIKVQVRNFKDKYDYVEIQLPELASNTLLKDGDTIKGKTSANWNSVMRTHAESGSLDMIIDNVGEITKNVNATVMQADALLRDVRSIVQANKNNLELATGTFSNITRNLYDTTIKLNNSVDQKVLDATMNNLEASSENLKSMTRSLDCATRNLTDTMDNVNSITQNVEEITEGVKCTMKKRFGGFRVIFGKNESCKCKPKCTRCGD